MAYDRDEWRTPWRSDPSGDAAPAGPPADDVATPRPVSPEHPGRVAPAPVPIARFPQPPPSAWDPTAGGPGSPPGSVRPPDTTGTHDAPPAPTRRGRTLLVASIGGLVGALVGGGIVAAVVDDGPAGIPIAGGGGGGSTAPSIQIDGDAAGLVPTVAEAVLPSVVSIDVPAEEVGGDLDAGGGPALGSGVVYRSDGYIVTNNHVVGEADQVTVRLGSGDILNAEVVGTDPLNDLAIVLVESLDDEPVDLPAINLRTDEELRVGESVIAIGSPFGLDGSVTTGIVSGLDRDLNVGEDEGGLALTIPSIIQTDAAINPGNSGGALVDAAGRLIGINTAILTRTGGSQGVGFAVPVTQAIRSADQLIEQGFVRHPLLGIAGRDVQPEDVETLGLDAPRGAIVDSVQSGTGAEDAGVEAGDVVVAVDGEPLVTMSQLIAEVRGRDPGDTVSIVLVRDGSEIELEVELSERPRS